MEDSRELLRRLQDGDPEALAALLEEHLPGLRAYVRLRGGPLLRAKEESVDLVQSVCREVLGRIDRFQYPSEAGFRAWLYATALRKIRDRYDYYLAAKRDARREQAQDPVGWQDLAVAVRGFASPSQAASAREDVERLEAAFDRLPEHYRDVLVEARLLGLSREEIGGRTGRTPDAVSALLARATAKLAGLLGDPGG